MSTFLRKNKDRKSFEETIRTKSTNTQNASKSAIRNFEIFCQETYSKTVEETIAEYQEVEMETVYESLQEWINWNSKRIHPNSIPTVFSYLKKYLRYHKIKITKEDVADELNFPHKVREEKYPLVKEEIRRILDVSNNRNKLKFLAQLSSGLRRGELLQLRKRDLDVTHERIVVNVPASMTKTKKSRVTFFSKEVTPLLRPIIKRLDGEDRIFFRGKTNPANISNHYQLMLIRYLERIGLDQKYESGRHKITTHSFRAFFITKVSRHDPNLAKYFAGQEQSRDLLMYDRLTLDEKLEKYIEFESDLLIYDT